MDASRSANSIIAIVVIAIIASILIGAISGFVGILDHEVTTSPGQLSNVTEASYIIYQDGDYTCAKNGTTGRIAMRSENTSSVVQYAVDHAIGPVYLTGGDYEINYDVDLKDNTILIGSGEFSTRLYNNESTLVYLQSMNMDNIEIGQFTILGNLSIMISAGNNGTSSNIIIRDITATTSTSAWGAFALNAYWGTIDNVLYENCKALDCDGFGFIVTGGNNDDIDMVSNVTYSNCKAINSGAKDTRFSEWVCGFDLSEKNTIYNMTLVNCEATGSWESGFHIEGGNSRDNVRLINCIAKDNGGKPGATYGTGYMVYQGMTFQDCISINNGVSGFRISQTGTGAIKLLGCSDVGSTIGIHGIGGKAPLKIVDFVGENSGVTIVASSNTIIDGMFIQEGRVDIGQPSYPSNNISINRLSINGTSSVTGAMGISGRDITMSNLDIDTGAYQMGILFNKCNKVVLRDSFITANNATTFSAIRVSADSTVQGVLIQRVTIINMCSVSIYRGVESLVDGGAIVDQVRVIGGAVANFNSYCRFTSTSGTATIIAGQTYIEISHKLAYTPTVNGFTVTPASNLAGKDYWISHVSATVFRININSTYGSNLAFVWSYSGVQP